MNPHDGYGSMGTVWARLVRLVVMMAVVQFLCSTDVLASADLTTLGSRIYNRGLGESNRPLPTLIGDTGVPAGAVSVACYNCHGVAGGGGREGDVLSPAIDGARLQLPVSAGPLQRPAYSRATFCKALTGGVSPSGRVLSLAMPRITLSTRECEALARYVQDLSRPSHTGVTSNEIAIGFLNASPRKSTQKKFYSKLKGLIGRQNRSGAFFGRHFHLRELNSPQAALESPPLVLIADRLDPDTLAALLDHGVTVVITGVAELPLTAHPYLFWTHLSIPEAYRSAIHHHNPPSGGAGFYVVHSPGRAWRELSHALIDDSTAGTLRFLSLHEGSPLALGTECWPVLLVTEPSDGTTALEELMKECPQRKVLTYFKFVRLASLSNAVDNMNLTVIFPEEPVKGDRVHHLADAIVSRVADAVQAAGYGIRSADFVERLAERWSITYKVYQRESAAFPSHVLHGGSYVVTSLPNGNRSHIEGSWIPMEK